MPNEGLRQKIGFMLEDATDDPSGISYHDNSVTVNNCHFNKVLDLRLILHGVTLDSIYFDNCIFRARVLMHNSVSSNQLLRFDSVIKFNMCIFKYDVEFNGILFKKKISFISCSFIGKFNFSENQLVGALRLLGTTFNNEVSFNASKFNNISFFSTVDDRTIFLSKVSFSNAEINDARFWNIKFEGDVYFVNTKFNCPVYLNNALFRESLVFAEQATFGKIEIKESIFLDGAEINKLIIANVIFEHYVSLNDANIHHVEINNSIFAKYYLSLSGAKIHEVKNEHTARTLKNEAIKAANTPMIIQMKAKELDFYYCSLEWRKNLFEKLPLWLMKYSNKYGEDWFRALVFILCCWVFFFSLFVISRDGLGTTFIWSDISYLKEAINFLWLLNSSKDIESIRTIWQVVFFLLGKISIAYGIYQLIAAFRKHGR